MLFTRTYRVIYPENEGSNGYKEQTPSVCLSQTDDVGIIYC